MIEIGNWELISPAIETMFPLMFEHSKKDIPEGVKFDACNSQFPPMNNTNAANNIVGALKLTGAITDRCNKDVEQDGSTKVETVDESSTNVCIKRTIECTNLK